MNKHRSAARIVLLFLGSYLSLGMTVFPNEVYAQGVSVVSSVDVAKTAINNYFNVLLLAEDATTAKNNMQTAIAAVLNPADKIVVGTFYDQLAVVTAHRAIDTYFAVLLNAQDPAKEKFVMESVISAVYNPVDKVEVGGYYDEYASSEAKLAIDNYFMILLAAQDPAKAKFVMEAAIAAVLNPVDKTTVGTYYSQTAVVKAKAAIDGYFAVLLAANTDPAKAKFVMEAVIAAVLNPVDKTTVGTYYSQTAVVKAKAAIDGYFAVLLAANTDPAKAKFVMESAIAAVLNPVDKTTVGTYYSQTAVVKAKAAIDGYFAVLLAANTDPAKAKFVMESVIAAVLNPADKTQVGAYYDEYAASEAKLAIDNYFKVLSAAQDPAKAKFVMESLIAAVLNPVDKTVVGTYYDQAAVINAKTAINNYISTLVAAKDPAKVKFIMESVMATVLNPADKTIVGNYYDSQVFAYAKYGINIYFEYVWALQDPAKGKVIMDSLIATVKKPSDQVAVGVYYQSLLNLTSGHLSTPQNNIGFAQSLAVVQENNELLIGAPNVDGKGAVYQYKGMPIDTPKIIPVPTVISPVGLTAGDQFGKTLVADKDTLVVQARTSLYFFSRVNNVWVENGPKLDLGKIGNLDSALIENMKLSLLSDKLAVALPSAGVVYIVSRASGRWTYMTTLRVPTLDVGKVQFAQSVAVGNGLIAVGSPKAKETEKSKIFIYRYKGQGFWQLEKTYEDDMVNFGSEVGLLIPQNLPAILTATKVVGHQLIVPLSAIPNVVLTSKVFVYNELLNAPSGVPVSTWNTTYSSLGLPWHSPSFITGIAANGSKIAVVMRPKAFSLANLHTTDSVIVFNRQVNNSIVWAYNIASAGVPNFGKSVALSGDTFAASYPQDDNASVIKSGVVVLSPKAVK